MIWKLLSLFFLSLGLKAGAQLTINVQLPPAGLVQRDQLWNVVAVNNTNATIDGALTLSLQETATGRTVLSANSGNVMLPRGVKVLTPQDVQPVQYNYLSSGIGAGYLPIGNYTACYRLSRVSGDVIETIAEECVPLRISPLSPPLLNTPADTSELPTRYPQFSWIPPTPVEMFLDLNYRISVAEVLPGQTPAQALLGNVPVYATDHLSSLSASYPSSYTQLTPGKRYAWQVQAFNGSEAVANTEVWSFRVRNDSASQVLPPTQAYIKLTESDGDEVNILTSRELLVTYYSYDRPFNATVRFFDDSGQEVQVVQQALNYGDNYIQFHLGSAFRRGKVYSLLLTDRRGNNHKLSFSTKN